MAVARQKWTEGLQPVVKRRRTPHGNVRRRTATLSVPFIRVSSLTTCRSAANATVVFERTTAARSRGLRPAASRHGTTHARTGAAFGCCNGRLDAVVAGCAASA